MIFPQMTMRTAIFVVLTIFAGPYMASGQQTNDKQPPQITADDFPRTRDLTGSDDLTKQKSVFVIPNKRRATYQFKRSTPRAKHIAARPSADKPAANKVAFDLPVDTKSTEVWKQLGVTVWRLGTESKNISGDGETARMLVQEAGTGQAYTPQRVPADTAFVAGDKVRLTFESPAEGFLYVIDREVYSDDKVGDPYLIFPTRLARGGDNRVRAGVVTDIPAQTDRVPYFTLKSSDPNWRGELLTVIVSPEPLKDLGLPDKPSPISASMVEALEDKYLVSAGEYEQNGTAGLSYTKIEKEAGSDSKRQLTQDDPFPQTVYRVKSRAKAPMLINLHLSVK